MKTIPLTRSYVTVVDDEDYEWLSQWKWMARPDRSGHVYAVRDVRRRPELKTFRMHRVLLGLKHGDGLFGDHVNGDTLDNSRSNLRIATKIQNSRNRRPNRNNTSGYKGVFKNGSRYEARIGHKGQQKHLGTYEVAYDAAVAYDLAALELYGEFALLNVVDPTGLIPTPPVRRRREGRPGGRGKLTESQVTEARRLHNQEQVGFASLSRRYGVSEAAITKATKGETYKWVS